MWKLLPYKIKSYDIKYQTDIEEQKAVGTHKNGS